MDWRGRRRSSNIEDRRGDNIASAGAGGTSSAGAGGDTGSNGATDSPSADGGCGCRYVRSGSDGLWWLVLCGAALLRRRRQALPHR